jgi:hypothetical protein
MPKRQNATLTLIFRVNQGVFIVRPWDHAGAIRKGCVKRPVSTANNRPFTGVSVHHWRPRTASGSPMSLPGVLPAGVFDTPAIGAGHGPLLIQVGCCVASAGPPRGNSALMVGRVAILSRAKSSICASVSDKSRPIVAYSDASNAIFNPPSMCMNSGQGSKCSGGPARA